MSWDNRRYPKKQGKKKIKNKNPEPETEDTQRRRKKKKTKKTKKPSLRNTFFIQGLGSQEYRKDIFNFIL